MELSELFPGLFSASFRGVEFYMPNSRHEIGRRVQRWLFPGRDDTIDEDLGAYDGPIHISGLLLGEDYIAQATRLERALRAAGPGLLSHPWLGELAVVLAVPAQVSFDDRKLRCATFEATFSVWREREFPELDTLGLVLEEIAALKAEVKAMLRQVLAPLAMPLAAIGALRSFATGSVATWRGVLTSGTGMSALVEETGSALAGLEALGNIPVRRTLPDEVAAGLSAVPAAVARPAALVPLSAIGSAEPATAPRPDPAIAARLLLDTAVQLGAVGAADATSAALRLASRLLTLAEAVDVAGSIEFDSQPQARAWHATLDAAIAATAADAARLAVTQPLAAAPLWRRTGTLRRAVAVDLAVRIGRLPQVVRLRVPQAAPAWLIAQHVAGDAPATVLATLQEIVRRNAIRRPGLVPPGELEILRPAAAGWVTLAAPAEADEEVPTDGGGLLVLDAGRLDIGRLG